MDLCLGNLNFFGVLRGVFWNDYFQYLNVTKQNKPMRNFFMILVGILLLASCSAPKYSYYFDHYDYNSGKRQDQLSAQTPSERAQTAQQSPLAIEEQSLVATTEPAIITETQPSATEAKETFMKKYNSMSKTERHELKKELKSELKKAIKEKKADIKKGNAQNMDHDLKLAIIFGAVGLVLTLFGGASSAFWVLGVIAIVIGVVFLIKWLMRQ
jgi:hypothetical protein